MLDPSGEQSQNDTALASYISPAPQPAKSLSVTAVSQGCFRGINWQENIGKIKTEMPLTQPLWDSHGGRALGKFQL